MLWLLGYWRYLACFVTGAVVSVLLYAKLAPRATTPEAAPLAALSTAAVTSHAKERVTKRTVVTKPDGTNVAVDEVVVRDVQVQTVETVKEFKRDLTKYSLGVSFSHSWEHLYPFRERFIPSIEAGRRISEMPLWFTFGATPATSTFTLGIRYEF